MQTIRLKEDNTLVLDDDVYYCLLVEVLDRGDNRNLTEGREEKASKDDIQSEDDTLQVATRSGRRSPRKTPTLSSTNGHSYSVQTRRPVTSLLSMMACREFSELLSVL